MLTKTEQERCRTLALEHRARIQARKSLGYGQQTSVTSALKTSPILQRCINDWCPSTRFHVDNLVSSVRSLSTIRPEKPVNWQRVGLAVEYAIRIKLGVFCFEDSMAAKGIRVMCSDPFKEGSDVPCLSFLASIESQVSRAKKNKEAMTRLSLTLARFAPVGRRGVLGLGEWSFSNLKQMTRISSAEAADTRNLAEEALRAIGNVEGVPMWDHPVFGNAIIGADGDFIVDGCLFDVKTTTAPNKKSELTKNIQQLLVYALLDGKDGYQLRSIGLILPRQSLLVRWPVEDFFSSPLKDYRTQFRNVLECMAIEELGWTEKGARSVLRTIFA